MVKILHCPSGIGGNPQGLAKAERELGLKSWSVMFEENNFQYETDEILIKNGSNRFKLEIKRWLLLWRAIRDYDIIHFNFGRSIMPQKFVVEDSVTARQYSPLIQQFYAYYARFLETRDLPLLKKLGKGIIVSYQGDDARQGDYCQANFEITIADEVEEGYYSSVSDQFKREKIAKFNQYADRIFALNPDLLHVLPTRSQFLPYSHIDLRDWKMIGKPEITDIPIVLHAPSHRGAKGTQFIIDAVTRLQNEGVAFEFFLVEGIAHNKAREIYEKADLLIDQLLAGWYGGLAVELMALGKPVICYLREGDLKFIPHSMRNELPIIQATSETIYHVLKQWLTLNREQLRDLGQRSRRYVEKWHDPLKIAFNLKKEYESILLEKKVLTS